MMIARPEYISSLERWRNRNVIKVITGVHRCGKSTLLKMFAEKLREEGVPKDRIVTINLELLENEPLLDYHVLHDEILSRTGNDSMNYVFIDEVQNVPDFQKAIDSLYVRDNIDLYITGSNAMLLSGTLATLMSGRYVEINVTPLSLYEFSDGIRRAKGHHEDVPSNQRLYTRYISTSSFPATIGLEDPLSLHDYLEGIKNTVLLKDVAQRLNVANVKALEALTSFLFDNIGNLTSAKRISDAMTASGTKISSETVSEYIKGLTDAYIFYPCRRFDIRGKRLLKLREKHYAVDMGMRRVELSGQTRDLGRILENVVFLELLRREGPVYVGRLDDCEVDFVTTGPEGTKYYQVSESVTSPETLERELRPLRRIKDNYPKLLLTLDDTDPVSHDGIVHVNAIDWLMGNAL